jgi:acetyl esterase
MNRFSRRGALALPLGLAAFATGCAMPESSLGPADPTGRADPETRAVLENLVKLGPKPIPTLSASEARRQPAFADGVKARMRELGLAPPSLPRVENVTINVTPAPLMGRIYSAQPRGETAQPLIVYYHGGGWVIADIDTYDASCRALARDTGAIVLAVHYRQGPEVKFPGAHDDANAAYAWALANATQLGADPFRVAVVGESAGGNLAINVAVYARDARLTMPRAMGLIYPVAGTDVDTPSYQDSVGARPLDKATILWMVQNYTSGPSELQDPRLNVYAAANLSGLPPAIIVNAEIDPLREDGARLETKLRDSGVPVRRMLYPGVTHEFFGADAVITRAKEAQAFVGGALRTALGAPGSAPVAPSRGSVRRRPAM